MARVVAMFSENYELYCLVDVSLLRLNYWNFGGPKFQTMIHFGLKFIECNLCGIKENFIYR